MEIKINDKIYEAQDGETILDVCRREGIRIPTLCSHGKLKREAVCRLCLVEINLTDKLVPSCVFKVCEKLEVVTESEKIKRAREINMELLWSDHAGKCIKCRKNRQCELQNLAEEYKIENFHFVPRKESITDSEERDLLKDNKQRVLVDDKNPAIFRTTEYCVECRRCINICPGRMYGFNKRSGDVVVGTPYDKILDCIFCGACVKNCPTGALADQNNHEEIGKKLNDLNKLSIAVIDPAILENLENEFGKKINPEKLAGILTEIGFEKVFMLDAGLQKYAEKLSEEVSRNLGKRTIFNSNCAAFNRYIQKAHPELADNLSKLPIPDELMAQYLKTEHAKKEKIDPEKIVIISISSCTAKKAIECNYLDYVLTIREFGRMVRESNIDLGKVKEGKIEGERIKSMGDMAIFGGTLSKITEKNNTDGRHKFACANKMDEIKKILEEIKKRKRHYDFVECMVCPGGCKNGGGNSIQNSKFKVQN
jgi:NADP-reducing hydrogenase subunit HndD